MFICTNKGSLLLRGIPSTTFDVVNVNRLLDSIQLAPNVEGNDIDAILVTSDDISSKVLVQRFSEALKSKHPEMVVLYVNKKAKSKGEENFVNVNYMLTKPTTDVLRATVTEIISASNRKAVSTLEEEEEAEVPDFAAGAVKHSGYKPGEGGNSTDELDLSGVKMIDKDKRYADKNGKKGAGDTEEEIADVIAESMEGDMEKERAAEVAAMTGDASKAETPEEVAAKVEAIVAPSAEDIDKVFANVNSTAELQALLNDISLEVILKDIMKDNAEYSRLEDHVSTLCANIDRIFASEDNAPTEEKLRRAKAIIFECNNCLSAQNTVIMKYIEKVFTRVINEATEAVTERVNELNRVIVDARPTSNTIGSTDILQLKQNRTNALVELDMFLEQLFAIEVNLRKLGTDAVSMAVKRSREFTGRPNVDNVIQREMAPIIPEMTVESIKSVFTKLEEMPDQMKALENLVRTTKNLIHKVLDVDSQLIEKQEEIIERLSLSNIAKAGLMKELDRRTTRVFIGDRSSGRTIIPYLFAKMHARECANVLYVNLTGTKALSRYGVKYTTLGEFLLNPIREDVSIVAGDIDASAPIEEILGAVQKANAFYSAIYIVVPEDNEEAVEVFTDTALAYYLICNPATSDLVRQINWLTKLQSKVCLKNVIFNQTANISPKLTETLGVDINNGITCFKVNHMETVLAASIEGEDPSYFPSVHTSFQLLRKYV